MSAIDTEKLSFKRYCEMCGTPSVIGLEHIDKSFDDNHFQNPYPELIKFVIGPSFWEQISPLMNFKNVPRFPDDIKERIRKFDEDVQKAGGVYKEPVYSLILRVKSLDLYTLNAIQMISIDAHSLDEAKKFVHDAPSKEFEWVLMTNDWLTSSFQTTVDEQNTILTTNGFEPPQLIDMVVFAIYASKKSSQLQGKTLRGRIIDAKKNLKIYEIELPQSYVRKTSVSVAITPFYHILPSGCGALRKLEETL